MLSQSVEGFIHESKEWEEWWSETLRARSQEQGALIVCIVHLYSTLCNLQPAMEIFSCGTTSLTIWETQNPPSPKLFYDFSLSFPANCVCSILLKGIAVQSSPVTITPYCINLCINLLYCCSISAHCVSSILHLCVVCLSNLGDCWSILVT